MATEEQQPCALPSFQKIWFPKGNQEAAAQRLLRTFVSSIRRSDTCHAAGTDLDASIQVMPIRALKLLYMKAASEAFAHPTFAPIGEELTGPLKHSVYEWLRPSEPCAFCRKEVGHRGSTCDWCN